MDAPTLLIIVDVQQDFVNGSLGTPEAQAMLPRLLEKVKAHQGPIAVTLDTHGPDYLQTAEGKQLPVPHCIKGTPGWELASELAALAQIRQAQRFEKPTFGSTELAQYVKSLADSGAICAVELAGLCTDICVISNALLIKAACPELPVSADAACCAGVTPALHEAALQVMQSCQVTIKRH